MKTFAILAAALLPSFALAQQPSSAELARLQREAATITITRDDWGIAHVRGHTDADAVFGMIYAQAEDDFNRVETNYLTSLGRTAQAEGQQAIWQDLRMKLFITDDSLKAFYKASPASLKALMNAWADGLNFYLAEHPKVTPKVLTHFEPWMALSFTEGSIGGDIEKVNLRNLEAFYGTGPTGTSAAGGDVLPAEPVVDEGMPPEPSGSNGMAIAPKNTVGHHALLLINPHTSFFFRSELQMTSDEGLDAYGAVTWGQFFIYQGWNPHVGWMHTSSGVDAVDNFLETIQKRGSGYVYKHGTAWLPVRSRVVTVSYKTATGMAQRNFTVYATGHGPVISSNGDKWETIALMNSPVKALTQSYTRTKAKSYKEFRATMDLHTNSSNNTIFADADGDIAYFHGNYIPRRNPAFDWTKPVDGSDTATDYHGLLSVDETPHLLNPASGWIYNSNNWPWSASGPSSPKKADFPAYVETGTESERGIHAIRLLSNKTDFTLDGLLGAAFDSYQPWFEKPIPALVKAWDATPATDSLKPKLADQIAMLRTWDLRWGASSVPTSLAVFFGQDAMRRSSADARRAGLTIEEYLGTKATPAQLLQSLSAASDKLTADFGTWKTPWGDINRFQRLNDNINANFDDSQPSIPVEFTSATWGSLASFGAKAYSNTKKWYGTSGNSFVAVIEFGDSIRARAVTAGGESGDVASKHFDDEAERYSTGNLRTVYFYPSQLVGHTERVYHPGK